MVLLPAPTPKGFLVNEDDVNNIITNSINFAWGVSPANLPGSYGVLLTLDGGNDNRSGSRYTQIFFGYQGDLLFRIAFRNSGNVSWESWYKITTTVVNN